MSYSAISYLDTSVENVQLVCMILISYNHIDF